MDAFGRPIGVGPTPRGPVDNVPILADSIDYTGCRLDPGGQSRLTLMGGWRLSDDSCSVSLPLACQRVLALLALRGCVPRVVVTSMLWPDAEQQQALGSLRTALWRIGNRSRRLVVSARADLALHPAVTVDIHDMVLAAERILDGRLSDITTIERDARVVMSAPPELLPGWFDDWALFERERISLLRVGALDALAERLLRLRRFAAALAAALASVAADPLRDSAHSAVIRVHLAAGNPAQAVAHFRTYQATLDRELGIPPSRQVRALISGLVTRDAHQR